MSSNKNKKYEPYDRWFCYMSGRPVTLVHLSMPGGVLEACTTCFGRNSRHRLLERLVSNDAYWC